jgi:hypothetical protein
VNYLNEFITPDNLQVQQLYESLKASSLRDTIYNCWEWTANKIKYVQSLTGMMKIAGKVSKQDDLWVYPNLIISVKIGNCFAKSTVLASLLRNCLPDDKVSLVLGNIPLGGHAWVIAEVDGEVYLLESTTPEVKTPFIIANKTFDCYDPIVFVNTRETSYVPDKHVQEPLGNCHCVTWLKDYLDIKSCSEWV